MIASRRLGSIVCLAWLCAGCRGQGVPGDGASGAPSASAAKPIDRLAPGELAPGEQSAFGLLLPRRMVVTGRFPKAVHAAGELAPEDVANYVREQVQVDRVELGAARTIFPYARIKKAPPDRRFQIDVIAAEKQRTILEIRDVTPTPAVKGIDQTERWKRAGFTPQGKMIEMEKME